jgi:hypothetical protein
MVREIGFAVYLVGDVSVLSLTPQANHQQRLQHPTDTSSGYRVEAEKEREIRKRI